MDKLKQRAKAKRREERRKQKQAENRQLAERFNAKCKAEGKKNRYTVEGIARAYKKVQSEIAEEAIIANTVAALVTMRRLHKWGARRLHFLAGEVTAVITDIGNGIRTPAQLTETLFEDAHLDFKKYWSEQRTEFADNTKKSVLLCAYARQTACVQLLATFYKLFPKGSISRKSKRMERIAFHMAGIAEDILKNDRLDMYISELAECGFKVTRTGTFGSAKLTPEENEKLKRRITA